MAYYRKRRGSNRRGYKIRRSKYGRRRRYRRRSTRRRSGPRLRTQRKVWGNVDRAIVWHRGAAVAQDQGGTLYNSYFEVYNYFINSGTFITNGTSAGPIPYSNQNALFAQFKRFVPLAMKVIFRISNYGPNPIQCFLIPSAQPNDYRVYTNKQMFEAGAKSKLCGTIAGGSQTCVMKTTFYTGKGFGVDNRVVMTDDKFEGNTTSEGGGYVAPTKGGGVHLQIYDGAGATALKYNIEVWVKLKVCYRRKVVQPIA